MPRSSSATPSDSSHGSESPRKRDPSLGGDRMDVDAASVNNRFGSCKHVQAMTGSLRMLESYEKALAWSGAKYGSDHSHSKRRKVGRSWFVHCGILISFKMQAPTCGTCKLSLHRPVVCLDCRFIGCWKQEHIQAHLTQSNHGLGNAFLSPCIISERFNSCRHGDGDHILCQLQ